MDKLECVIPFQGFYETDWDAEIDMAIEDLAEYLAETREGDMHELIYRKADFEKLRQSLSAGYAAQFVHCLDAIAGTPLNMAYVTMQSPKEYNFTTDRIFVTAPLETWRKLRDEVLSGDLANHAKARHTSRSGFISFYSPNTDTWGHVDSWDLNQRATLLLAWLETKGENPDEIEADILDNMRGNGAFQLDLDEGKLA